MNFAVRPMQKSDYRQVSAIFSSVHALHQENRPEIYRRMETPLSEA